MSQNNKLSRIRNLDVIKAICAFLIIHIHYSSCILPMYVDAVARVAVPLFAMISGYFYRNHSSVIKQILKNLLILVMAEILYLFVISATEGFAYYMTSLKDNGIKNVLFCQFSEWIPGWFILGLIYAYILIWLFDKLNITKWVFLIFVPILLVFLWIGQRFDSVAIIGKLYYYSWALRILPFFMIGNHFRAYGSKFKNISNHIWIALIVLGTLLTIAERWISTYALNLTRMYFLYVGTFVLTTAIFGFAIYSKEWNLPFLQFVGCELSMYIYVIHMAVISICRFCGYEFDSLWICVGSLLASLLIYYAKHCIVMLFCRRGKTC